MSEKYDIDIYITYLTLTFKNVTMQYLKIWNTFLGSLMIFAWILLSSLGIIIARYYKSNWKGSMPCGVKVWFAVSYPITFWPKCCLLKLVFVTYYTVLQSSIYLPLNMPWFCYPPPPKFFPNVKTAMITNLLI